jgi:hypothetical protein
MHNPADEVLADAINPKTQQTNDFLVIPSRKNYRRHQAMLLAAVTAVSLAGIAALISLKPVAYIGSRADVAEPAIIEIEQFVESCDLHYEGCHDPNVFVESLSLETDVKESLLHISQQHNLNPRILLTLEYLQRDTSPSKIIELTEASLVQTAEQLVTALKNSGSPPRVFNHPTYGPYKLSDFNESNFALLNFVAVNADDQAHFESMVQSPDAADPYVVGFVELFNALALE